MAKASKAASKLHDTIMMIASDDRTPKVNQAANDLLSSMMEADSVNAELSFMIKFKTIKGSTEALNLTQAQNAQHKAAKVLLELIENSKAAKAFVPNAPKE